MLKQEHLEFLADELGVVVESVQHILATDIRALRNMCSDITMEEYELEESDYDKYDPVRLTFAEDIQVILDGILEKVSNPING